MKKLFSTFLAIIYFGLSAGANFHSSCCMGNKLAASAHCFQQKSPDCGMAKKAKPCRCNDREVCLSMKADKNALTVLSTNPDSLFPAFLQINNFLALFNPFKVDETPVISGQVFQSSPPIPIFLLYRNLRI